MTDTWSRPNSASARDFRDVEGKALWSLRFRHWARRAIEGVYLTPRERCWEKSGPVVRQYWTHVTKEKATRIKKNT